jgi:hypothetical protein
MTCARAPVSSGAGRRDPPRHDHLSPLLDALELVKRYADGRYTYYPAGEHVPTHKGVLGDWSTLVFKEDAGRRRVVRSVYEIGTFQALREQLRCKEIWVVGANEYRNPDEDLPADFETRRGEHSAALRKPLDATKFIDALRGEMRSEFDALEEHLPTPDRVQVHRSDPAPVRQGQRAGATAGLTVGARRRRVAAWSVPGIGAGMPAVAHIPSGDGAVRCTHLLPPL